MRKAATKAAIEPIKVLRLHLEWYIPKVISEYLEFICLVSIYLFSRRSLNSSFLSIRLIFKLLVSVFVVNYADLFSLGIDCGHIVDGYKFKGFNDIDSTVVGFL